MAAGSPFGNFWREIATAAWLANVGLPLLVTVGAIVAAAVALRVQIGHDRELQRAARRAAAAHELGARLAELVEEFRDRPPADEWWSERSWPGRKDLVAAVERAKLVFDHRMAFAYVDRTGRDLDEVWKACWRAAQRMDPPDGQAIVAGGLRDTTAPLVRALADFGRSLLRWDGHPPLAVPVDNLAPVPSYRDRDARRAWDRAVAEEFERHVRERDERQRTIRAITTGRPVRRRPSRRGGS